MRTKDRCSLSFKSLQQRISNDTSENQYSNLNLTQKYHCSIRDTVHPKHVTPINRKNYDSNESNFLRSEKDSACLKKSPTSNFIHSNVEEEERLKRNDFPNAITKSSSTLSLHIAAYEDSIEGISPSDSFNDKHENEKSDLKLQNGVFTDTKLIIQNPFEFPRQQENTKNTKPEIAQFIASQKLLNPNVSNRTPPKIIYRSGIPASPSIMPMLFNYFTTPMILPKPKRQLPKIQQTPGFGTSVGL